MFFDFPDSSIICYLKLSFAEVASHFLVALIMRWGQSLFSKLLFHVNVSDLLVYAVPKISQGSGHAMSCRTGSLLSQHFALQDQGSRECFCRCKSLFHSSVGVEGPRNSIIEYRPLLGK